MTGTGQIHQGQVVAVAVAVAVAVVVVAETIGMIRSKYFLYKVVVA